VIRIGSSSPCDLEIAFEPGCLVRGVKALRPMTEHQAGVEDMIIQREVTHRSPIEPALFALILPTDLPGGCVECQGVGLAPPVGFQCKFELTPVADTRKSQIVCSCHGPCLSELL
jgi:hypothetical protein